MALHPVVRTAVFAPFVALAAAVRGPAPSPAEFQLTMATLHAAALTAPRDAGDAQDDPFVLVSIMGPGTRTGTVHLPSGGHLGIHLDEALGAAPLADRSLQPGDSVRLLVSVLESARVNLSGEALAATESTGALALDAGARASRLSPALAPITAAGGHWLGSAALLVTNEAGVLYWRSLECVVTCKVVKAPADTPLAGSDAAQAAVAVLELTGAGGTYHLQLQGKRAR